MSDGNSTKRTMRDALKASVGSNRIVVARAKKSVRMLKPSQWISAHIFFLAAVRGIRLRESLIGGSRDSEEIMRCLQYDELLNI